MDKINKISVNGVEYLIEDLELTEVVESLKTTKQDVLSSGVNIKTVNGETILGEGDIEISFEAELNDKQDVIEDLEEIRSNASLGATALQSIPDEYATKSFVKNQVAELVGSAPDKLNTLGELAKALKEDDSIIDTLNNAINEKQEKLVSGTSIKTINGESLLGEGEIVIESGVQECVVKITYSDLKTLWGNDELVLGLSYHITDYHCTTTEENTKASDHQFDIIVTATSENTLSHLAKAILHEGDTYFENCNLEAWQLWYDIDNDTSKYAWADEENGKGVIYRMIDEHNNDCPYDFKSILFYNTKYTSDTTSDNYYYTFSYVVDGMLYDGTIEKQVNNCYSNVMKEYLSTGKQYLSKNVFRNTGFSAYCYNNTFKNNCFDNTLGNGCSNNTFGEHCCRNTFGDSCGYNAFGNGCYENTFGNNYDYNAFGNDCGYNTFENNCKRNTFGDGCTTNIFGNYCCDNAFGNSCGYNAFGNYYKNINLENDCLCINLNSTSTTSTSNYLQNIKVTSGVSGVDGPDGTPLELTIEPDRNFETRVAKNSKGKIKIYCEADLIN